MPKTMIRCDNQQGVWYAVWSEEIADSVKKAIEDFSGNTVEITSFAPGRVPLEMLPEEIQHEAKETLKAFDEVSVVYEHEGFHVTTAVCLCANYAKDHFVCGRYLASEVFTTEERRKNSLEEFGYIIPHLKGKDYQKE